MAIFHVLDALGKFRVLEAQLGVLHPCVVYLLFQLIVRLFLFIKTLSERLNLALDELGRPRKWGLHRMIRFWSNFSFIYFNVHQGEFFVGVDFVLLRLFSN